MRPAVFLDRDGTIIEDVHYLGDPDGVRLLPGAAEAIRRLNHARIPVLVVTNQSGIGRGMFSEADFLATQQRLLDVLAADGAHVEGTYHCPHAPAAGCDCRKPRPGLFLRAARDHQVDAARSVYIGDRLRDLDPGLQLGGTGYLLSPEARTVPARVQVVASLAEAVQRMLD